MTKRVLISVFLFLCLSVFSQSFSRHELFFVTEHFSLVIFPMQDELLLFFRKNGNPIKNAKVCFYKDGHITKPQNTARDGTLLIKRPEESFVQFRFGSYRTIHTFALSQYKNIIRHEIKAEWENNLLHLEGKIFSEVKKVRLVYRNGQDVENEQEVEVDNGMFRQQLLLEDKPFFIDIYTEEEFVCTAFINAGVQNVDVFSADKIKTSIPQKTEITSEMQLDCRKISTAESMLLSFSRCGEKAEKLYFADNGKIFDLQPAMNDGILSGNAEIIMKNGDSIKENFCMPVLPLSCENKKFRSYETADKEIFFFSQEEWKDAFLIFYNNELKYARSISLVKGINKIELPVDLQKISCISAAIVCADEKSGNSAGLFCRFVNTANEIFYDIGKVADSAVFLTPEKNTIDNGLKFYCKLGNFTDDESAVYGEIFIKNLEAKQRNIKLQTVFPEDAVCENLLEQAIILEPKEELQIRFDLPLNSTKKSSRNLLVTELTQDGENAVFWMPSQNVENILPYFESFTMYGRLIENRTSEVSVVLPENEVLRELNCFLSTDAGAFSMTKGFLTENCAEYVFEEALLNYLQKRRHPREGYDDFGFFYPYFLNSFFSERNLIRRFSFDKNFDVDSSLLYLYAASRIPDLEMPKKTAAIISFFRNNLELLSDNPLRQELFYRSVKETHKIAKKNGDFLYAGQPVESWLFTGKKSNPPESTIGKIIQLLPEISKDKNSDVKFELSQSFSPTVKNSGNLIKGQSVVNKIELPENYVSMTGQREIRYKITKNGSEDLFYLINGRFYSNQIDVGVNMLRLSVKDCDDMPLYSGDRLMKNTKYLAKVHLPDELKNRQCVLLLKDRMVSAVQQITLSDGKVWETGKPVFFSGEDLSFSFFADISFYFDDICFIVLPLVSGEPWAYYAEYSE